MTVEGDLIEINTSEGTVRFMNVVARLLHEAGGYLEVRRRRLDASSTNPESIMAIYAPGGWSGVRVVETEKVA